MGLPSFEQESVYTQAFRFGRGGSDPRSRELLVTAEVALSTLRLVIGDLLAAQQSDRNQQPGQIPQTRDLDGITAFDAVERELGLKLLKRKRTIPVIVVDHVMLLTS